jgi:chromosome partitioning protein
MARRIAVVNQKGGVGKTTTAVNLSVCLALRGFRVLLVDYDPQANASHFLGFVSRLERSGVYSAADLTFGFGAFRPLTNVLLRGLDLVPATPLLGSFPANGTQHLRQSLGRIEAGYDFILVDCAPALGPLSTNAMVACPEVVLPLRLEPASIPGALRTQATIEALRRTANGDLRLSGVVGTFHKETGRMARDMRDEVVRLFGALAFQTAIHQSDAVGRASGSGIPIVVGAPRRREALEYQQLTQEVIERGSY